MSGFFISAAHKSSGKTVVSIGLCAALRARAMKVQPCKKGPDYIDPIWLSAAAGTACRNLDFWTQSAADIQSLYARVAAPADIAVVEGNKGLHDGMSQDGSDSNAALAKLLGLPVILVIDTQGVTRGIAPLLLGMAAFEPSVRIGGVILNKVGGARHEAKLRAAIAAHTDIPVLGAIPRDAALSIDERHLGLIPANEHSEARERIEAIATVVVAHVDLDAVRRVAATAFPVSVTGRSDTAGAATNANDGVPTPSWSAKADHPRLRCSGGGADFQRFPDRDKDVGGRPSPTMTGRGNRGGLRIAVARDAAFGFYYQDDLDTFSSLGCTLLPFDTLRDPNLPRDLDGMFIGGGFPETHAAALEANVTLRAEIAEAIGGGLPTYAECGGLMYLSRAITFDGERRRMVGVVPAETVMMPRPQGRGYVRLSETNDMPWGDAAAAVVGHEFHHAALTGIAPNARFAYRVKRGHGMGNGYDGIVVANTVAAFTHLRGVGTNRWPERFVDFIQRRRALAPASFKEMYCHV